MQRKTLKIVILSVVPLLFFIICISLLSTKPPHFTIITDPEYFHLLTGLNIAQLKFVSGDYHHPCLPMQILQGIIIKLVYFFSGQESDIISDVFLRSEFYVSAINISFILIIAVIFFVIGIIIYRITGEVLTGAFMQTIVFVNPTVLFQLTVSVPERLALPFIALLICLLIWYIYKGCMPRYYPILLGLAVGFCFMQKYTMLPLVILPLFVIRTWRERKIYAASFLITSALLFIPIISHLKRMREYFTGMFFHTGLYGSGKEQIFDLSSVLPDLSILFHDMTIPMYSLVVLILFMPVVYLVKSNKSDHIKRIRKVMLGAALVQIIILLMVLKHFKTHYYTPAAALSFFNLYLCYEYLKQRFLPDRKVISTSLIGLMCLIPLLGYSKLKLNFADYHKKIEAEKSIRQVDVYYRNYPTIIIPRYYGSPFIEFSLWTANYYSYNMEQYGSKLKELYPDSYSYSREWGMFDMAYTGWKTKDVLLKYDNFILSYFYEDTSVVNSFYRELDDLNKNYSCKRTFFNQCQGFAIDEIKFLCDSVEEEKVLCVFLDMETEDTLTKNMISANIAKSGNHSIKMGHHDEYAATVYLNDIMPGDRIIASIWRYNNGNRSSLVVKSKNSNDLYFAKSTNSETYNLWQLIRLDVAIPDTVAPQQVKVYLWHNDKGNDAYFDDFSVSLYR